MNTRKLMIYAHLILASFFMPLLLMMPFTGVMYLSDNKGTEVKTEAFRIPGPIAIPEDTAAREAYFRAQFAERNIDFDFEYIRGSNTDFIFRPATRVHHIASVVGDEIIVTRVEPSLLKRMIELHKGHGPLLMKAVEATFGIALILVTLSGVWLAWTVKPYRKATLISFGLGTALIVLCLL